MRSPRWADFWAALGLTLVYFRDVGLTPASSDRTIWQTCQAEQLLLITNNRNQEDPDSLEATLRELNTPDSLPVFTISDIQTFRTNRAYAERVVESLYDYIIDIEGLRGTGPSLPALTVPRRRRGAPADYQCFASPAAPSTTRPTIHGEVRDVCISEGKIVASVEGGRTIDATGMVVFPGGVDVHTHVAGAALNFARGLIPEQHRQTHPMLRAPAAGPAWAGSLPRPSPPATCTPAWAGPPSTRPPSPSCPPSTPTRNSATPPVVDKTAAC
jgi:Formylmethanofuran dehydrogenase subunit A